MRFLLGWTIKLSCLGLIYLGLTVVVSGIGFSFLSSQTRLYTKNMSIVRSHTNLRSALDRLVNSLQQANGLPLLISTTGANSGAPFQKKRMLIGQEFS